MAKKVNIAINAGRDSMILGALRSRRSIARFINRPSTPTKIDSTVRVRAVLTSNVTLSGTLSSGDADGVTVLSGERVLAPLQSAADERYVYLYNPSGAWSLDASISYQPGMAISVISGTVYKRSTWKLETEGGIVPGETAVTWGLDVGTVIDGGITSAKIAASAVGPTQLASTTVTPGSYTSADITVDADGRITAAANGSGAGDIRVRAVVTGYDFSGNSEVPNGIPSSSVTDGVTVPAGQHVLLFGESDLKVNGPYIVAVGDWERSPDTISAGTQVQVMEGEAGSNFGGAVFYCRNTGAIVIGTTNITFGLAKALPPPNSVNAATIVDGSVGPDEISAAIAGPGLTGGASSALGVNVDGSTLEISSDTVRVKAGGIDTAQLAPEAVAPGNIDPSGAPGQVLGIVSGAVGWTNPSPVMAIRKLNDEDKTLSVADLLASPITQYDSLTATHTVNIPPGSEPDLIGHLFVFKDASGSASLLVKITIEPESPSTIDGAASIDIDTARGAYGIYADGANWQVASSA